MKRKRFDTILTYVALTLLLFLIQRALGEASRGVANLFSYERFDPDHAYLGNMVHHTAMMLLTLTAVLFLKKVDKLEFGLGLGDKKAGFRYVALYTAVFAGITLVVHVLMRISNSLPVYAFPLNRRNIIGTLVFQLFFTGPAEELLFRALPITIIVAVLGRSVDSGLGISLETIIAALLFALAHANGRYSRLLLRRIFFHSSMPLAKELSRVKCTKIPTASYTPWPCTASAIFSWFKRGICFFCFRERNRSAAQRMLIHISSGLDDNRQNPSAANPSLDLLEPQP